MDLISLIVSILIGALISGFVIWIVGRLGIGIEVSGFGPAFVAAIIIAVVSGIVTWLLGVLGVTIGGGLLGAIVYLVIAAVVLMISGYIVPGFRVNGFLGALIAVLAIGVVGWVIGLVLNAIGLA